MALDPGTFGGTPACHRLVEMLNERGSPKLASSVVKFIQSYREGLGDLVKDARQGHP